jgi:hypothetical protein
VGIFLGWIVQKRWLTLVAFVLNVLAFFTLTRLPIPYSYLIALPPALWIFALFYEGSAGPGLRIGSRMRLAWGVWMGVSVLLLMLGIMLANSNGWILITTVIVFAAMVMAGALAAGIAHARRLREERLTRL